MSRYQRSTTTEKSFERVVVRQYIRCFFKTRSDLLPSRDRSTTVRRPTRSTQTTSSTRTLDSITHRYWLLWSTDLGGRRTVSETKSEIPPVMVPWESHKWWTGPSTTKTSHGLQIGRPANRTRMNDVRGIRRPVRLLHRWLYPSLKVSPTSSCPVCWVFTPPQRPVRKWLPSTFDYLLRRRGVRRRTWQDFVSLSTVEDFYWIF